MAANPLNAHHGRRAAADVRLLVDDQSRLVSFGYLPAPGPVSREEGK